MFSFSATLVFTTFILLNTPSVAAFWRLLCDNPLTIGRYDPIVSPGAIASHVHTVSGGSGFAMSTTYDEMRNASCTSCQIQQDLSNYWIPQLYYQNPNNGSFEDVSTIGGMTVYYLQRGSNYKAFPPGFRMLAGSPNLRSWNDVQAQQAINFVCLDYTQGSSSSVGLPTKNCPEGMRAQIVFPSCWNGVDLDSSDHKSHMAYPDAISDGNCPAGFPVRLVTLFYEVTFLVDDFSARWYPAREQPFVFAMGDPTGYGLHGDFINGWDQTFLQEAVDTCLSGTGLEQDCPLFDLGTTSCHITPQIDELVSGNLTSLPGCNPVQFGPEPATAQSCAPTAPTVWNTTYQYEGWTAPPNSHFLSDQAQTITNYSTWEFIGCYGDGLNPRTLPTNVGTIGAVTVESCLASCQNNNFAFGGMESGNQCWCGGYSPASQGASLLSYSNCATTCAGNDLQLCGGDWALSVYNNTAITPPSIPAQSGDRTASYVGCFTDNSTSRVMPHYMGTTNGTVDGCVTACENSGYAYSGIEYMGECYCSATLPSSSLKMSDAKCDLKCSGDSTKFCGAGDALQVYSGTAVSATELKQIMPYAGCYTDSTSSRSLNNYIASNLTVENCLLSCRTAGYTIAGLEYGGECYCDHVVASTMTKVSDTDCNMKCTANSAEICGSGNRLSVYNSTALVFATIQTNVGGMSYAGCWSDDSNRVMQSTTPQTQTVGGCVAACQAGGYTQAGVEYGGQCYCGPLAARSTKRPDSECSMTCVGDGYHYCGAGYRLQLYNTTSTSTAGASTSTGTSTSASFSTPSSSLSPSSSAAVAAARINVATQPLGPSSSTISSIRSTTSSPAVAVRPHALTTSDSSSTSSTSAAGRPHEATTVATLTPSSSTLSRSTTTVSSSSSPSTIQSNTSKTASSSSQSSLTSLSQSPTSSTTTSSSSSTFSQTLSSSSSASSSLFSSTQLTPSTQSTASSTWASLTFSSTIATSTSSSLQPTMSKSSSMTTSTSLKTSSSSISSSSSTSMSSRSSGGSSIPSTTSPAPVAKAAGRPSYQTAPANS